MYCLELLSTITYLDNCGETVMRVVSNPERMSFKRKVMAMYAGKFHLQPHYNHELVRMIETGMIVSDSRAVQFIDENGEWLA